MAESKHEVHHVLSSQKKKMQILQKYDRIQLSLHSQIGNSQSKWSGYNESKIEDDGDNEFGEYSGIDDCRRFSDWFKLSSNSRERGIGGL